MTDPVRIPSFDDVAATALLLRDRIVRTPLLEAPVLNQHAGGRVLLKLETLQHTSTFKFRGAMSRLLRLDDAERRAGVLAWSSGNHAQAVAAAARELGISATIVMPSDAPAVKLDRTRGYGARVVTYQRRTESREQIGKRLAREGGLTIVAPYDDRWVIAGQGTVGLEVLEQCAERGIAAADLLVCCGGGGLTAGCALAMDSAHPPPRIWTVEPEHYDDHARSFASGRRETADVRAPSLCDALLAPAPGEITFAVNRPRVAGGLVVTDAQVRRAMAYAFHELRLVIEPGGAAALAAILAGGHDARDRVTVVIVSGGNVDPALFAQLIHRAPGGEP